jgi:hypothetical protein
MAHRTQRRDGVDDDASDPAGASGDHDVSTVEIQLPIHFHDGAHYDR